MVQEMHMYTILTDVVNRVFQNRGTSIIAWKVLHILKLTTESQFYTRKQSRLARNRVICSVYSTAKMLKQIWKGRNTAKYGLVLVNKEGTRILKAYTIISGNENMRNIPNRPNLAYLLVYFFESHYANNGPASSSCIWLALSLPCTNISLFYANFITHTSAYFVYIKLLILTELCLFKHHTLLLFVVYSYEGFSLNNHPHVEGILR